MAVLWKHPVFEKLSFDDEGRWCAAVVAVVAVAGGIVVQLALPLMGSCKVRMAETVHLLLLPTFVRFPASESSNPQCRIDLPPVPPYPIMNLSMTMLMTTKNEELAMDCLRCEVHPTSGTS